MSDPWGGTSGSTVMSISVQHLAWQDDASCQGVGVEPFYAEKGEEAFLKQAKRVCNGDLNNPPCVVREACLDHALVTGERFGVWGGMSPRQRAREATERRREAGTLGQRTCQVCSALFPGGPGSRNCSTECGREARRRVRVQRSA